MCDIGVLESPIMPSSLMRREQAARLAGLLPVRPLSAVLILLFALVVEPSGDVVRGNRPSWFVRINCAGVDDQSLVEFRSREFPGFFFGLKCPGCSRASPFQQRTAFVQLKSNVPGIRHLSLDQALGRLANIQLAMPLMFSGRVLLHEHPPKPDSQPKIARFPGSIELVHKNCSRYWLDLNQRRWLSDIRSRL
jgi:hypothetical protein